MHVSFFERFKNFLSLNKELFAWFNVCTVESYKNCLLSFRNSYKQSPKLALEETSVGMLEEMVTMDSVRFMKYVFKGFYDEKDEKDIVDVIAFFSTEAKVLLKNELDKLGFNIRLSLR